MSIKKEAAYHEAGHAVAAWRSPFHRIEGPIDLQVYGAGQLFISLSRSKLQDAGIAATPEAEKRKDVARSFAVILVAGLVAERIAAERYASISPNPQCAEFDHAMVVEHLSRAGLSKHFDRHEATARELLLADWDLVEALASALRERIVVQKAEVDAIIEAAQRRKGSESQDAPAAE